MRIRMSEDGVERLREPGDKALSRETEATHHLRRLLNAMGIRRWVRFWPDRCGMTACRQGVRTSDGNGNPVAFWHARYQVEAAHKAFNSGSVFYSRA